MALRLTMGPYNGGSYPGGGRMGTQPAPDTAWQNPRPPFSQEGMNSQPAAVPQEASEPKGSFFEKKEQKRTEEKSDRGRINTKTAAPPVRAAVFGMY